MGAGEWSDVSTWIGVEAGAVLCCNPDHGEQRTHARPSGCTLLGAGTEWRSTKRGKTDQCGAVHLDRLELEGTKPTPPNEGGSRSYTYLYPPPFVVRILPTKKRPQP